MPSRLGARKAAAQRLVAKGVIRSVDEYLSRLIDGERWCSDCQQMHPREMMGRDAYRLGGRAGRCRRKGRTKGDTAR
jgi:hypothetical protein